MKHSTSPPFFFLFILLAFCGSGTACQRFYSAAQPGSTAESSRDVSGTDYASPTSAMTATLNPYLPPTRVPGAPVLTPTPDAPHAVPTMRTDVEQYVIQPGDILNQIAHGYGVSAEQIAEVNDILNPDLIAPGQILTVPVPSPAPINADFKIIPDSELVNGPYSAYLDTAGFIQEQDGFLASYREEVIEDLNLTGIQIVERVSQEFSVNPRLLLAVLEYQTGWVTESVPGEETLEYPLGFAHPWRTGLYRQLAWAANELNRGYYLWRANAQANWVLADGTIVKVSPVINASTAGAQHLFSQLYDQAGWVAAVSEEGLFTVYEKFFGYPFDYTFEPLVPLGLGQPSMQLPFESGTEWSFTGGPHGGWGNGSAWAGIDFAPPGDALGCVQSDEWVVAMADGLVVRSGDGVVVLDLDRDGLEQTGWTVLYLHIESRDRVPSSTMLRAGERIGHPSCEGGVTTGTHVHLARRYNGEWIPADGPIPYNLEGWISSGTGIEYDGFLIRNGQTVEAWNGRLPENQIRR